MNDLKFYIANIYMVVKYQAPQFVCHFDLYLSVSIANVVYSCCLGVTVLF